MLSDIQLINQIKKQHDSSAALELVNRHTGIYVDIINQYSTVSDFRNKTNVDDLREDKFFNIYQWALKYDPNRGMQFGSYVGEMTKYLCKGIVSNGVQSFELNEEISPSNDTSTIETAERDSVFEEVKREVKETDDPTFKKIFALRFGDKPKSWREIGEIVGLTHEGARKVYLKHFGQIKEHSLA